jgi:hypothetical protein
MKTIFTNKSLLITGGLLLIALGSTHYAFMYKGSLAKTCSVNKEAMRIRSQADSNETTLIEEIAGKLLPVLKNLSKM